MILPIRIAPLPRSLAVTAALLLAIAFTSLLIPSTHAQTDDSALAPSNLTAELVDGQVSLSWDAPAEDAGSVTGYEVLRRPLNGKDTLGILVADTGNTDTAFIDETANEPGVRYTYRVKALRGDVESLESNQAHVDIPESTTQKDDPRGGSSEDGVYTWRDGDRIMTVRLEPSGAAQESPPVNGGKSVRTVDRSDGDAGPVFRSESGGGSMTLPGGVLLVLDPSWTGSDADAFFSRNGIKRSRVTELAFTKNAYLVETAPGLPSLQLANSLAEQKGVEISSPNWMSEVAAAGPEDPEGDTIETATDLPLNIRLEATLHGADDVDFFRIELSESALVSIANLDSDNQRVWIVTFTLLDSSGSDLSHETTGGIVGLRRLEAGTYYIKAAVNQKVTSGYQGPYNIQAMTIPDPGDTFESAAFLNLMADDPPVIRVNIDFQQGDFHTPEDVDFFKVELSADAEVMIKFLFPVIWLYPQLGLLVKAVNVDAFDEAGNPLHPPIPGFTATRPGRGYSLEAGTYYFRLSLHPKEIEKWGIPPNRTAYYSLQLVENVEYAQFIDDCSSVETDFDDPLLGCQGHLPDVNVKDVWATNKGEGINIAVVDKTMDSAHADLRDNINETLNHDYTEEDHIFRGRDSHGTAVAGVIAARDNDLGVRGVAPRATIYNYNYLERSTLANLVDAMTRNKSVTAISNNSYGWRSQGGPIFSPQVWNLALETGVREGFDGKGTFYVFAAGNEHLVGGHVNLRESNNFYAQATVCAVDSAGERVHYSETGYALWVCAPLAEVTADHRSRYRYDFSGTSSAAPVVSGVAALVRSANTSLTWRDVKLLLAASARQNDPANSGWEEGALEYGAETERYSYNPEYGFGVVDAKAAVDLAESWTILPPMETARVRSGDIELAIPDPSGGAGPTPVSSRLTLGPEVGFTEFVEVHVDFDHQAFRDLEVELHSPAGTVSKLAVPDEGAPDRELRTKFRFGSARHLGEDPSGEWTLKVTDHLAGAVGSIRWWGIKVYGHGAGEGTRTQQAANSPATWLGIISGSVRVGDTLSADVSSIDDWNGLSGATFSYQWIRNDRTTDTYTDIPGATEATYTLVAEDEGHAVKVRVTFTDNAGYLETAISPATNAVRPLGICDRTKQVRNAILRAIRGVSNCSRVSVEHLDQVLGLELTGSGITALQAGDFHDLPNVNELRLDRNDLETLPDDVFDGLDGLRRLRLNDNDLATLPKGAFDGLDGLRRLYLNDNDLDDLPDGAFDHLESLRRLRLNDNDLSDLPDGIFEGLTGLRELWLHSNPGAPFTFTAELERRSDTSVVVKVAQGAPFDIEVTLSVTGVDLSATTVAISGGSTSSGEIPIISDGDGPVTVSVTSAALQFRSDQGARGIQVRAGDPLTLTEGEGGNTPAAGEPTISGTVRVGETLTADTSGISDADGLTNATFNYQWLADDADIAGAIGLTYILIEADEDKAITVQVSFTDDRGHQEALTSAATDAVATRPNNPATGTPTITGTAQVGQTLTADTKGIADADGLTNVSYTYQWLADDADIAGAIGLTYILIEADEDKAITVQVSFTDDRGHQETLTSSATAAVATRPNSLATGAPTISGTAQVGQTLTADTKGIADADGLTNVSYTYQWLADDADIAGAIGLTYILIEADEDKAITVQVSFTDDRGHQETLTSSATAAVATRPNSLATGAPTISGTAQVGETLTAGITGIADADGLSGETFTYQWVSGDGTTDTDIEKATDSTYKLVASDQGRSVKVRVTFTDDAGNEESLTSAPTEPVLGDGLPGAPRNLTATAGNQEVTLSWEPPDDNGNAPATRYRIEWRIDGKDYKKGHWGPSGETTYTKTDLANGVKYIFRVKAENGNGNSYGPYGPASEEVSATPTSGSAVDLGTPVLSNTKTLHHGMVKLDWEDVEDAGWYVVQYYHVKGGEWLDLPAAGVDIAFHGSSAVVSNLHGLSWLRVRAMSCAGESEWSQIEELYGTNASDWEGVPVPEVEEGDEIEPCPVVLGTPVLSNTETLHHGMVRLDWEDIEDAGWYVVQYYHVKGGEWLDLPAEGVDIAFHGSSAVVSNLHGLSWLRVRAMSCAGASEWSQIEELYGTNASDWEGVPVPEVAEGDEIEPCSEDADTSDNTPATGVPTISGTAQVGETLTANTSGVVDADGLKNATFSYQWLADNAAIAGATGSTYTLADSEEGKAITVQVSFTDDADNEETLTSAATGAVDARPNSPATGVPTITGTTQVGQTLTADTSGIADADGLTNATFSYQWLADNTDIAGATNAIYTLTDSEESKAITVQVSYTDASNNEETLTSAATDVVAGAQPTEPPAKPRNLSATATHDSVTLTWDDPGDDTITGYVILRRIPGVDPEGHFDVLVADTGTASTTYTDDTVSAETRYTYRIKAINGAGTSERSRWSHIDVPAAPVPDKPTGLEATESHGQVVLTWDDPGDDSITGYVILRRVRENDTGGDFSVLVANTGSAATTYIDDTVAAGTTYTYRIKAINEHGVSERSSWFHIDIPEAP